MKVSNILRNLVKKHETPLQLRYLYDFGNKRNSINKINQTKFLYKELSIRMSHRLFDLLKLPYGLPMVADIKSVINLYSSSISIINSQKIPQNLNEVIHFTNILEKIKYRHTNLEIKIADGLKSLDTELIDNHLIDKELNNFFLSRISIRTLISQQIETIKYDGNIFKKCNIVQILNDVINDIDLNCQYVGIIKPKIIINYSNKNSTVINVCSNIYYIFNEIIKNAIVAHNKNNIKLPIEINVIEGKEDIIIKISDKGLGFNHSKLDNIFSYSYSTTNDEQGQHLNSISGYGFGLPLSKLYTEYFGGNLYVIPMDNGNGRLYLFR